MTQKEYSDYIISKLTIQFPQFENCISFQDEISTIEYSSNLKLLSLWITTLDNELTIGFEGKEPKWDWHTHMSLFNAYEPDDEIKAAVNLINDILLDKELITCSSVKGYSLTDDIEKTQNEKADDETIEFKKWSEL